MVNQENEGKMEYGNALCGNEGNVAYQYHRIKCHQNHTSASWSICD